MSVSVDLDNNGANAVAPGVPDAMVPWLRGGIGNLVCPNPSRSFERCVS